jgi:hypothetical protein
MGVKPGTDVILLWHRVSKRYISVKDYLLLNFDTLNDKGGRLPSLSEIVTALETWTAKNQIN